jgi:hypothetical protein
MAVMKLTQQLLAGEPVTINCYQTKSGPSDGTAVKDHTPGNTNSQDGDLEGGMSAEPKGSLTKRERNEENDIIAGVMLHAAASQREVFNQAEEAAAPGVQKKEPRANPVSATGGVAVLQRDLEEASRLWGKVDTHHALSLAHPAALHRDLAGLLLGKAWRNLPQDCQPLLRDFTAVEDVVRGILAAAEKLSSAGFPGAPAAGHRVYNVGRGQPTSVLDLLRLLEQHLGVQAAEVKFRVMSGEGNPEVLGTWADTSLISQDLGVEARVGLAKGIEEFVRWYRSLDVQDMLAMD